MSACEDFARRLEGRGRVLVVKPREFGHSPDSLVPAAREAVRRISAPPPQPFPAAMQDAVAEMLAQIPPGWEVDLRVDPAPDLFLTNDLRITVTCVPSTAHFYGDD